MIDKTFITGADSTHEIYLKWWLRNFREHNKDAHVTICDFGLTSKAHEWIKENADWVVRYEPHSTSAWFYKTQVLIDSIYDYSCWIDVDCQVVAPIEDIFEYAKDDKIGLTIDKGRKSDHNQVWWATGVNVIKGKPQILYDWHEQLKRTKRRGDQEALHEIMLDNPSRNSDIVLMPAEYQWLRVQLLKGEDTPNKKIIHWTGNTGKNHIEENLMISKDFF